MTDKIDNITFQGIRAYNRSDYSVTINGWTNSEDTYNQLRELFALASTSAKIRTVRGRKPLAIDHTEDSVLTVYCQFSSQAIMHLKTGWYLLLNFKEGAQSKTPRWLFTLTLHYIGTTTGYQEYLQASDLESLSNDWNI